MNVSAAIRHHARYGLHVVASACAIFIATSGMPIIAHAKGPQVDEAAHTPAAVIAVDEHWLRAEEDGDTAWLGAMLLPDFRTINHDGKVVTKSMLLKSTAKNRGSDKMRKRIDAWRKTHPSRKAVVMHGDVAILSFVNPQTGHIWSSDIFVYENGHWRALYSQQSASKG
ncbi:MAG TPA: nuclear transport factor 2 family protein [Rhodanobacteraceae bacterium]|nr:nuclear transport factor 2 family protein [Rhodanobacteraceae bacterium]